MRLNDPTASCRLRLTSCIKLRVFLLTVMVFRSRIPVAFRSLRSLLSRILKLKSKSVPEGEAEVKISAAWSASELKQMDYALYVLRGNFRVLDATQ